MFYRESGQFKSSYAKDQAIFPIRQDQIAIWIFLAIAFIVGPLLIGRYDYLGAVILIPFLVYAMAALLLGEWRKFGDGVTVSWNRAVAARICSTLGALAFQLRWPCCLAACLPCGFCQLLLQSLFPLQWRCCLAIWRRYGFNQST